MCLPSTPCPITLNLPHTCGYHFFTYKTLGAARQTEDRFHNQVSPPRDFNRPSPGGVGTGVFCHATWFVLVSIKQQLLTVKNQEFHLTFLRERGSVVWINGLILFNINTHTRVVSNLSRFASGLIETAWRKLPPQFSAWIMCMLWV